MNCPVCDEKLRPIVKYDVEIDICPGCKGIWLDRGELEKMIAAINAGVEPGVANAQPRQLAQQAETGPIAAPPAMQQQPPPQAFYPQEQRHYRGHDDDDDDYEDGHHRRDSAHGDRFPQGNVPLGHGQRRRGSWLTDLLEGFGGGD